MILNSGIPKTFSACLTNMSYINNKSIHFMDQLRNLSINPLIISLPESNMETCSAVLAFQSVNEILWCDPSN